MFNKKLIIDSLKNLSKPSRMTNKNTFDLKESGSKREGFVSAQEGVDTPIYKAVKTGASPIEGKGLFAEQSIRKGDVIGVSHIRKKFMKNGEEYKAPFPSTVLGYYNHSEEPNVYEVDKGDYILMVAGRDIQRGHEITSDYTKHNIGDLEVPDDFKKGGSIKRPSLPNRLDAYTEGGEPTSPEEWVQQIKDIEGQIGNPSGWTLSDYNTLQNKLNEYKSWRENTPEGQAVIDTHNEEREYDIPLPEHLQDYTNAMMKARLAYANEFGNPAAKRMINLPDTSYQFDNGDTGTHYMASMDNYAVPQIQDENGVLQLGDYGPESNEAIRFDSDEDANYFAENYKDVSPGFLNQKKKGGSSGCPKGEYWNGTKCVKIPKNTRIVYHTDKDVYDKAFAAESDSSHFYNNAKSDFNKFVKLGDRFSTHMSDAEWQKTSDQYYKLLDSQQKKWHTDEYRRDVYIPGYTANYKPGYTANYKYKGPKSGLTIKPVGLEKKFYREGYVFPRFKKPVVHNVYEEPIKEEEIDLRLPPLKSGLLPQQNYELQGTYEEDQVPEYSPSYPKNRIGYDNYNWYTTKSGLHKRQKNTGGFYDKMSKKVEDIKNYMEGYDDEDGNYIPGEIEKAKQKGRQIKFKGNVSKDDKEAQEKYIQEYGDYENLKNYQNQIMNLMQYKLNQKQYGGLHKFVGGGSTNCDEGYEWNEELQECVEDTSKYNQQSYAKHLAEKKIYEDALKEIEVGTTEYAILEEAYNAKVKKLEKEKARVLKVRGNVIPASQNLDIADNKINSQNPLYQNFLNASNPKELELARKALPQEIKNVLPNQGSYNIAKWDSKINKWNEQLHPFRELYCTPYGCFAYQKAGASDVPIIGGNIDFANRAATGDFVFEKINPNERQPGDMALVVEMAPNNYSDPNAGMSRRPHHTTIYAEPDPRSPKDTKAGNFYSALDGNRLFFNKSYLVTKREPGDRFDYYRYVGAQNKINNEVLDLAKQKEEFNIKQEQRKNNAALPSIPTLKPNLITQNNTATFQYPKKEETLKPKNKKLFKKKSFKYGGLNKHEKEGMILDLSPEEIKQYTEGGYVIEDISVPQLTRMDNGGEPCPEGYEKDYLGINCIPMTVPEQVNDEDWYKNWYANRTIQDEEGQNLLETARPKILKRTENFPEIVKYSNPFTSELGSFEPLTGKITLNEASLKNNPFRKNEVLFHEKGHYLTSPSLINPETDTPEKVDAHPIQQLRNYEAGIVEEALKPRKDVLKKDRKYYDYLKGKGKNKKYTEEISKMLMGARRLGEFQPDQKITDKDIEDLYKKAEEKGWLNPNSDFFSEPLYNLKEYTKSPEQIKILFNKLAENKSDNNNEYEPRIVKYGGSLHKFIDGGQPCPPCPDGTVPIRTEAGDCPCANNIPYRDKEAQEKYIQEYGDYENLKNYQNGMNREEYVKLYGEFKNGGLIKAADGYTTGVGDEPSITATPFDFRSSYGQIGNYHKNPNYSLTYTNPKLFKKMDMSSNALSFTLGRPYNTDAASLTNPTLDFSDNTNYDYIAPAYQDNPAYQEFFQNATAGGNNAATFNSYQAAQNLASLKPLHKKGLPLIADVGFDLVGNVFGGSNGPFRGASGWHVGYAPESGLYGNWDASIMSVYGRRKNKAKIKPNRYYSEGLTRQGDYAFIPKLNILNFQVKQRPDYNKVQEDEVLRLMEQDRINGTQTARPYQYKRDSQDPFDMSFLSPELTFQAKPFKNIPGVLSATAGARLNFEGGKQREGIPITPNLYGNVRYTIPLGEAKRQISARMPDRRNYQNDEEREETETETENETNGKSTFDEDIQINFDGQGVGKGNCRDGYVRPCEKCKCQKIKLPVSYTDKRGKHLFGNEPIRFKEGGISLQLTKDEIQKYVNGGYVVEDLPYELGDTVDKATMERLRELGYTFETI